MNEETEDLPHSEITQVEFIETYFEKSNMDYEARREWLKTQSALPCACGEEGCKGWGWYPHSDRDPGNAYKDLYMPKNLLWDGGDQHWTTFKDKEPTKKCAFDVKIYESALSSECPYWLPETMISHGRIKTGYHTIVADLNESQVDTFYEWAASQTWLKIIGINYL